MRRRLHQGLLVIGGISIVALIFLIFIPHPFDKGRENRTEFNVKDGNALLQKLLAYRERIHDVSGRLNFTERWRRDLGPLLVTIQGHGISRFTTDSTGTCQFLKSGSDLAAWWEYEYSSYEDGILRGGHSDSVYVREASGSRTAKSLISGRPVSGEGIPFEFSPENLLGWNAIEEIVASSDSIPLLARIVEREGQTILEGRFPRSHPHLYWRIEFDDKRQVPVRFEFFRGDIGSMLHSYVEATSLNYEGDTLKSATHTCLDKHDFVGRSDTFVAAIDFVSFATDARLVKESFRDTHR